MEEKIQIEACKGPTYKERLECECRSWRRERRNQDTGPTFRKLCCRADQSNIDTVGIIMFVEAAEDMCPRFNSMLEPDLGIFMQARS